MRVEDTLLFSRDNEEEKSTGKTTPDNGKRCRFATEYAPIDEVEFSEEGIFYKGLEYE